MIEHYPEFAISLVSFAKIIGADKACLAYIRLGRHRPPRKPYWKGIFLYLLSNK